MPNIESLFRYPIKGFTGERLELIEVSPGQGFPGDRGYAISNGTWSYDAKTYLPRTKKLEYVSLMSSNKLATLRLRIIGPDQHFEITTPSGETVRFSHDDAASVSRFIDFLILHLQLPAEPRPQLAKGSENEFTDLSMLRVNMHGTISVINLASVRDLAARMGVADLDPRRFRANIYIDGLPAWEEEKWIGHSVIAGDIEAKAFMGTPRCAVTMINPATGERDSGIPQALKKHFGHINIGVYLDVTKGGVLKVGDILRLRNDAEHELHEDITVLLNGVNYTFLGRKQAAS